MAATFRYFARHGFNEGMSGHISIRGKVRDPEHPGCMWMNPLGVHFGLLTAGHMICLEIETGKIVGGGKPAQALTANAAGYLIHSAIHKRRPGDIHAICHAHTDAGRAWSLRRHRLRVRGGERIADALGDRSKGAILMNHGLLTVGATVDEAGFLFGLLDRGCRHQLQVEAAAANGLKKNIISDEEAAYNFKMASEANALYREAQPDLEYEFAMAGGEEVLAKGFDALQFTS
ncbi:class 2 aldolase adducin domain containing protein [Apiospora phragmitis]|uniref:Class 2 aldolase adducin domain containing protein n=1 Tax=Apiospora phragmitis TaxID=2905665 RepID=A0ABR1WUV4_9PEZI